MLTYYLLDMGLPIAAGGASFGGSIGAFAGGAISMIIIYFSKRKEIGKELENSIGGEEETVEKIIRDLLIIAIPITIGGAAIVPIMNSIDAF